MRTEAVAKHAHTHMPQRKYFAYTPKPDFHVMALLSIS